MTMITQTDIHLPVDFTAHQKRQIIVSVDGLTFRRCTDTNKRACKCYYCKDNVPAGQAWKVELPKPGRRKYGYDYRFVCMECVIKRIRKSTQQFHLETGKPLFYRHKPALWLRQSHCGNVTQTIASAWTENATQNHWGVRNG